MIYLDIETYSELDVTEVGSTKYAAHPSTEVLLLCYAIDRQPVQVWDGTIELLLPEDLLAAIERGDQLVAHNCAFERLVLTRQLPDFPADLRRWEDTSLLARTCGLPGDLDTLSRVLELDDGAHKARGRRLIQRFCKPTPHTHKVRRYTRYTHPEEWEDFIRYCVLDVAKARHLWETLPKQSYRKRREDWAIDQRINARGIPVDLPFVAAVQRMADSAMAAANARLAKITGGKVPTVNAVAALADFCGMPGVDAPSVAAALSGPRTLSPAQREALEIRQACGKSGVAKYEAATVAALDGRVHDGLMFHGAERTGRAAGRLVQPQNMQRPGMKARALRIAREAVLAGTADLLYDDPLQLAGSLVRTLIAPPAGRKIVAADLANIEGRVLAWLAGEEWKLQAFRDYDAGRGPDLYRVAYARSFGVPIGHVGGDERQVGKVMELALGYQGGAGAFESMANQYGVCLAPEVVGATITNWRAAHPATTRFWEELEAAACDAVLHPEKQYAVGRVVFAMHSAHGRSWLTVRLPSGRPLFYFNPRLEGRGYWKQLVYTGRIIGSQWGDIVTYGGKLAENLTQAVAHDVLIEGISIAHIDGWPLFLHAHDEVVADCEDTPEWSVRRLCEYLSYRCEWYEGLPLAAAGYEDYFYRKD